VADDTTDALPDALPDQGQMTLVEHLSELRRRLIISLVAVAVGAVVVFALWDFIIDILSEPYARATESETFPDGQKLVFLDPLEGFLVRIKVSTYGGIILALPVVLWQVWRFVTPGLYAKEKRYAIPFVVSSVFLFALGAVFAWLTIDKALDFLLGIGGDELQPLLSASKYISLIALMMVAFGAAFELPLLLVFLLLARVVNTAQLRRARRWAIVGIAVFAAVITPSQDPYSLFLLMIPMCIFYEIAILIGRVMHR
jgi:sec-independent protein translocase protein TatC